MDPRRIAALVLAALLLSGCHRTTTVILPPETQGTQPSTEISLLEPATEGSDTESPVTQPTDLTEPETSQPTSGSTETSTPKENTGSDKHQHVYTNVVVTPPTCTKQGYTTYTCACGRSYKDDKTPATGHQYTDAVVTPPTCTKQGYTTYTCACGHSYKDDKIPATGHQYTEAVVTPPTCTRQGYTTYSCACGRSYTDDTVPATGHQYTETLVPPTCTEGGYTLHTCVCGKSRQDSETKALGHDYRDTVVDPTPDSQGYTDHVCDRCGHSYRDSYTDPIPTLATTEPVTEPTEPSTEPTEAPDLTPSASSLLALINQYRSQEGLSPLTLNGSLSALAQVRAYECWQVQSHTRPDGRNFQTVLTDGGYTGWTVCAENLLYATQGVGADYLVDAWMYSSGHRANLMSPEYSRIGLGFYNAQGNLYVAALLTD